VLILDEPTAGVDIEIRREMWDFLRDLNQKGTTIILTTHYLEEAEQLCNNMAIINKGEVVEQGSVKELLGKMDKETFIFDLEQPLPEKTEALVNQFGVKKIDADTIEMTVNQGESINDAITALNRLDIRVRSMRNKSNRLEEFFLQKINKA
jgi:ABC-2 type transport system ATP-binding protein